MKKYLMTGIAALAMCAGFTSCSHDDEGFATIEEAKYAEYQDVFVKTYGKIASNQDWGFGSLSTTRSAETNSNQWGTTEGTGKYKDVLKLSEIPAITEQELEDVLEVFNQKGDASYTALVDWSTFFVQQVFKGTASHPSHAPNQSVVGGEKMDWLCAFDPIANGDDHVNNFNNANGSVMLMMDSSTRRFGFKSTSDNGHVFYYFRMEVINGMYYVGLDFAAEGQNPNEQVDRDFIYNDWIVKIIPGQGYPKIKEQGRIFCEDLGSIGDFDFNDVVFDAKIYETGAIDITVLAAGGKLPITVAGVQINSLMGTMVNTGLKTVPYQKIAVDAETAIKNGWTTLKNIPVVVEITANQYKQSIMLRSEIGGAPQKICLPIGTKWPDEYVDINAAYPNFENWVRAEKGITRAVDVVTPVEGIYVDLDLTNNGIYKK